MSQEPANKVSDQSWFSQIRGYGEHHNFSTVDAFYNNYWLHEAAGCSIQRRVTAQRRIYDLVSRHERCNIIGASQVVSDSMANHSYILLLPLAGL